MTSQTRIGRSALTAQLRSFRRLPLAVRLLLFTEMMFNIGFYLVVPFLATYMSESLAATGTMIGLVLGLRTFSQQGLFFLGGALTDRFGVKRILLIGITIRIIGFVAAGLSHTTMQLMVAVILIGFAAALFSPAAEASFAVAGREAEDDGIITRSDLFALDALFLRIGALIGPVLGALLLSSGFDVMCFIAAGIFGILLVSHAIIIPAVDTPTGEPLLASLTTVLRNPLFLVFALFYSTGLVTYNQQYLLLPIELERATGSQSTLGWMFVFASVLVLTLQMPLAAWAQRRSAATALMVGVGALIPAIMMLVFLHVGQMIALPIARDLVGIIATEKHVGTYFGFLNSFGGLAVLISSLVLGRLEDWAKTPQPPATVPWLLLTAALLLSTVALPKIAVIATRRRKALVESVTD